MTLETLKRDLKGAFYDLDDMVDITGFLRRENLDDVIDEYFNDCSYLPRIHEFVQMKGHDENTYRHSLRVGALSWIALKSTGKKYRKEEMAEYCIAGILHDCGKIKVDKDILQKKGGITKEQYKEIQAHTSRGESMVEKILEGDGVNTGLIKQIVKYHHEDRTGNGYHNLLDPEKFNGYVELVAIADIIDSTVFRGIYQGKCGPRDAMNFIEMISTDGEDKKGAEYLNHQLSKITDEYGRPYFKNAVPGRFSREYALPYMHLFRNHAKADR